MLYANSESVAVALAAVGKGFERLLGAVFRVVCGGNRVGQCAARLARKLEKTIHCTGVMPHFVQKRKWDIR